jgi:hypothetical protein
MSHLGTRRMVWRRMGASGHRVSASPFSLHIMSFINGHPEIHARRAVTDASLEKCFPVA